MFGTKSTKHPHPTRISSTLGKVFRLGLAVRVKVAGAQPKDSLDGGSSSGSDEKKDQVPDLVPDQEKLEDKTQIVVAEKHLHPSSDDGVVAETETESLPLPVSLPYHPSQSDSTQEPTESPELEFQDAVEYQPPEYTYKEHTLHRLSTVPEVDVEALKTPTNVDGESRYRLSTLVELEYYEPRAAYDFVDDEELEELDSPSSPRGHFDPATSSNDNRLSREAARDGGESDLEGGGGTTWDSGVPDDRIYEAHFRLTPCGEFEDCSEDGLEPPFAAGEGREGVDNEAEAELEEAWLAVLEEQKAMAVVRKEKEEREGGKESLKQVMGARSTKEGQVGEKKKEEEEREDGDGGGKEKAENKPMDLVKSEDSNPNIPASSSSPPTSDPPAASPNESEPDRGQEQPMENPEGKEAIKVEKERDLTPEEEASLIAHWEKRKAVYERHAASLEHILSSNPSNKAWLQRSGLNVDELLRCLRWTPEGFEEVVQEVQALSGSSSSSAGSSSSGSGSAPPLSGEKGASSGGTSSSDVMGLVGEGDGGVGVHEEDEEEKKAKFQARQKKLRELRSQHRRNTRKLLENTKKVDEMMAVLTDLLRGMTEAAEKKRAERQKEKEREKERERERRRKAAEEVRRRAAAVKAKEREEEKERWTFVEKPSEAEKVNSKEKEKERRRTSTTTPTKVVSLPRSLTSTSPSSARTSVVQPKAGPSKPRAPVSSSSNSSQLPQPPSPSSPSAPTKKRSIRNLLRPSASFGSTKSKSTKEKPASPPVPKKADSKSSAKSKKSKRTSSPTTTNNKRSPSVAGSERTRGATPSMPPRLPPTPDYASSLGVNVEDWLAGQALLREGA